MTKTTNYQLPKWEKTDRVQMKDFNDMTATLDEALHGLAVSAEAAQAAVDSEAAARAAAITVLENKSRFTKIKEVNAPTTGVLSVVSLSDISWAQWDKVHLDIFCRNTTSLALSDSAGENTLSLTSLQGYPDAGEWAPRLTLDVGFLPDRRFSGSFNGAVFAGNIPFTSLTDLKFYYSGLNPGSQVIVWGEK